MGKRAHEQQIEHHIHHQANSGNGKRRARVLAGEVAGH